MNQTTPMPRRPPLLSELGLKEYEATALETLLRTGRTTAPNLAETTDIPKARIYGVLDNLADQGYVKIMPGRPKQYQPKHPREIVERAKENHRQKHEQKIEAIETEATEFIEEYGSIYEGASQDITPTEELFYVVNVGEPSESETRALYHDAEQEVNILTKSFEYLPNVEHAFKDALNREVTTKILFVAPEHLTDENREIQQERTNHIDQDYTSVECRYSREPLPWRGTLADPSMDYSSGKAIFLVEEKDIPLHMRQAAVTENASFVAGMKRYFDLIWQHDSKQN